MQENQGVANANHPPKIHEPPSKNTSTTPQKYTEWPPKIHGPLLKNTWVIKAEFASRNINFMLKPIYIPQKQGRDGVKALPGAYTDGKYSMIYKIAPPVYLDILYLNCLLAVSLTRKTNQIMVGTKDLIEYCGKSYCGFNTNRLCGSMERWMNTKLIFDECYQVKDGVESREFVPVENYQRDSGLFTVEIGMEFYQANTNTIYRRGIPMAAYFELPPIAARLLEIIPSYLHKHTTHKPFLMTLAKQIPIFRKSPSDIYRRIRDYIPSINKYLDYDITVASEGRGKTRKIIFTKETRNDRPIESGRIGGKHRDIDKTRAGQDPATNGNANYDSTATRAVIEIEDRIDRNRCAHKPEYGRPVQLPTISSGVLESEGTGIEDYQGGNSQAVERATKNDNQGETITRETNHGQAKHNDNRNRDAWDCGVANVGGPVANTDTGFANQDRPSDKRQLYSRSQTKGIRKEMSGGQGNDGNQQSVSGGGEGETGHSGLFCQESTGGGDQKETKTGREITKETRHGQSKEMEGRKGRRETGEGVRVGRHKQEGDVSLGEGDRYHGEVERSERSEVPDRADTGELRNDISQVQRREGQTDGFNQRDQGGYQELRGGHRGSGTKNDNQSETITKETRRGQRQNIDGYQGLCGENDGPGNRGKQRPDAVYLQGELPAQLPGDADCKAFAGNRSRGISKDETGSIPKGSTALSEDPSNRVRNSDIGGNSITRSSGQPAKDPAIDNRARAGMPAEVMDACNGSTFSTVPTDQNPVLNFERSMDKCSAMQGSDPNRPLASDTTAWRPLLGKELDVHIGDILKKMTTIEPGKEEIMAQKKLFYELPQAWQDVYWQSPPGIQERIQHYSRRYWDWLNEIAKKYEGHPRFKIRESSFSSSLRTIANSDCSFREFVKRWQKVRRQIEIFEDKGEIEKKIKKSFMQYVIAAIANDWDMVDVEEDKIQKNQAQISRQHEQDAKAVAEHRMEQENKVRAAYSRMQKLFDPINGNVDLLCGMWTKSMAGLEGWNKGGRAREIYYGLVTAHYGIDEDEVKVIRAEYPLHTWVKDPTEQVKEKAVDYREKAEAAQQSLIDKEKD